MLMLRTTYEIWDTSTNEILVDNLTFDQAAEQSAIYQEFFGSETISVVIRESARIIKHTSPAQEYKQAWINYFGELQAMGNLN